VVRVQVRAVAALAAVVLVACTLLVGWHKATVTHGVCVEHGDEVHLDRVGDAERAQAGDADQIGTSTWELIDGDHHCAIAAISRDPHAACGGDAAAAAPDLSDDATTPPPARAAAAAVALYRLAPKTSPPV
jgi:hypothetical protein